MKILFLSGSYNKWGGVRSMLALVQQLHSRGHQVAVVIGRHGTGEEIQQEFGVCAEVIPSYNWTMKQQGSTSPVRRGKIAVKRVLNLRAEHRLAAYLRRFSPDVVVMNSSNQYVGIRSCVKLGIPVVMHFREFMTLDHGNCYWSESMVRRYFSLLSGGIAISRQVRDYFTQYHIPNLKTIYNGIDPAQYALPSVPRSRSAFRIACVGRLCEGKNQLLALHAARLLAEEGLPFHLYFYAVVQGDYARSMETYIRENGLERHVTLAGDVSDPGEMYAPAHINLLCSRSEAFGRVIVEGMLNRCLSVVANAGGAREIVRDGENGLLFESGSPEALYRVLKRAMAEYDALSPLREQGYRDATERFSCAANAQQVECYLTTFLP